MYLRSDASDKGHGGYAFQDINKKRQLVGFHSKTYTRAQRNYSAGVRELLSIYKLIEVFHTILFGRYFTVYTNHLQLTFLFNKAESSKRLQRCFENLAIYSFTIKYIPGKDNIVADALSRLHDNEEAPETAFSNDIILANLHKEIQCSRIPETPKAPNSGKVVSLIAALNTSCKIRSLCTTTTKRPGNQAPHLPDKTTRGVSPRADKPPITYSECSARSMIR